MKERKIPETTVSFGYRNGRAVQLLFAHRKKEKYQAKGFQAFVHSGLLTNGKPEVFVGRKLPKNHGEFIT